MTNFAAGGIDTTAGSAPARVEALFAHSEEGTLFHFLVTPLAGRCRLTPG